MQAQMEAAQAELADAEVEGSAGGGLVTATVTGTGEIVSVIIDPKAVDPGRRRDPRRPGGGGRPAPLRKPRSSCSRTRSARSPAPPAACPASGF